MKPLFQRVVAISQLGLLTGCAHNIQLTPPMDNIRAMGVSQKIDKNAGYCISDEKRNQKFTSDGGGGDDVEYYPYKDTEGALNTVLSKVFFASVFGQGYQRHPIPGRQGNQLRI